MNVHVCLQLCKGCLRGMILREAPSRTGNAPSSSSREATRTARAPMLEAMMALASYCSSSRRGSNASRVKVGAKFPLSFHFLFLLPLVQIQNVEVRRRRQRPRSLRARQCLWVKHVLRARLNRPRVMGWKLVLPKSNKKKGWQHTMLYVLLF